MPETILIRPADLLFDEQNPRLSQPNSGQRETQLAMVRDEDLQRKLLPLVRSIVTNGIDPTRLPVVIRHSEDASRFIVLEGNRRLSALRALENPDTVAGTVAPSTLKQLRGLSKQYWTDPVDTITCCVAKDRVEARPWIKLTHTGQNNGAGVVPWGTDEIARFEARTGLPAPYYQALEFLVSSGELTPEDRTRIPTTSFERLMDAPAFREKMGVEVQDGRLFLLADARRVAKSLAWVASELASGRTKVRDIYSKENRTKWLAETLPAKMIVKPTIKSGHGVLANSVGLLNQTDARPKRKNVKIARERDRLIPSDCTLSVTDPRLLKIEKELRKLSLENYANAVAVLFRVFIELSVDVYIETARLTLTNDPTLRSKLQRAKEDLVTKGELTRSQATPVQRACEKDSFLAPSVTMMQQYVHSKSVFPAPSDLRAHWDSLQPFITAMWSAR